MRRNTLIIILIILIVMAPSCKNKKQSDEVIGQRAQQICEKSLILDSHIDWPEYVLDKPEDISMQTVNGDFDLVRARKEDSMLFCLWYLSVRSMKPRKVD